MLGGPAVKLEGTRKWPIYDGSEEQALVDVLRSGKWGRGSGQMVLRFESKYAALMGVNHCLATANGTSALLTSMAALEVGPGDEVILPPYTFVATLNAVLERHALPVFVDSDRKSFQIDAKKVEAAVTPRTRVIMPVHMAGAPADMDTLLAVGAKHKVPVLEDACQAVLGEWRGKKLGTLGALGCFSFQASKNLNSGEGGAVMTNDESLFYRCSHFHSNGRSPHKVEPGFTYAGHGLNLRLTEFQGGLLLAQLARLEAQSRTREQNADYLAGLFREIPGIAPSQQHEGCTRNAWHLFMFRYDQAKFGGLPRAQFLKALAAEGVPASSGYTPLNKEPLVKNVVLSRGYRKIYSDAELKAWDEKNHCPENDKLCQEAVWFTQTTLLGPRTDMDRIATAVRKIQRFAKELKA